MEVLLVALRTPDRTIVARATVAKDRAAVHLPELAAALASLRAQ